jgi:hypothetical protein
LSVINKYFKGRVGGKIKNLTPSDGFYYSLFSINGGLYFPRAGTDYK